MNNINTPIDIPKKPDKIPPWRNRGCMGNILHWQPPLPGFRDPNSPWETGTTADTLCPCHRLWHIAPVLATCGMFYLATFCVFHPSWPLVACSTVATCDVSLPATSGVFHPARSLVTWSVGHTSRDFTDDAQQTLPDGFSKDEFSISCRSRAFAQRRDKRLCVRASLVDNGVTIPVSWEVMRVRIGHVSTTSFIRLAGPRRRADHSASSNGSAITHFLLRTYKPLLFDSEQRTGGKYQGGNFGDRVGCGERGRRFLLMYVQWLL